MTNDVNWDLRTPNFRGCLGMSEELYGEIAGVVRGRVEDIGRG